ncbi:hypothetical protein KQH81_04610 [Clostridium cadaveris]|uniref:hypothetical protein n=1 Tax=Clostridium cadaveris TaxID=1529 RepID=UPI001E3A8AF9|nr:hypothetical protein [Clostridium cadaveris]UFH65825.1 hypothetical protein KQH81_04610 [Clostridium cadaveris]
MGKSFLKKITVLTTIIICFSTITAFAVSSFTYNGSGIRGKRSVGRLTADSGISVSHTNSNWNIPYGQTMEIWADRNVWWGWSTEQKETTKGEGTTNFDFSGLPSGTYSFYFHAPVDPACTDISGSASGY